jgi:hypothetical protein
MYRVSDEQIEFILNDIKQRGVEMEDLQNNLLDHICCILEQEITEENKFETAYQKVIKQFFKHALWEIEEETILLLKYKNYYKMKRFLHILLFLSIGFNLFVFSKIGYDFYKGRQEMQERGYLDTVTLKDGFDEFIEQIKKDHPEALQKQYFCIDFIGGMSDYEEEWTAYRHDTTEERRYKQSRLNKLKSLDSIAGIYNKDIAYFIAFNYSSKKANQRIQEYTPIAKHFTFIKGQQKLSYGICNEEKAGIKFLSPLVVLDKTGKIIFKCKYLINEHIFLSKFLKTLSKDTK